METIHFPLVRTLHVAREGRVVQIQMKILGIDRLSDEECACRYSLPLLAQEEGRIHGCDEIQALELCLLFLRELVANPSGDGSMEVWWSEKGDAGGFVQ